jgi:hypothetical protein
MLASALLLPLPRPLRRMPDVDNDHFVAIDAVVDTVRRSSNPKRIQVAPVCSPASVRIVFERAYSSSDPANYFSSCLRASLIKI